MSACWGLKMPPPAKAVLISLADMANDDGHCWPSIERICERTCYGRTAVIDAVHWLESHALLRADRSNGRKTTYWVTADSYTAEASVVVPKRGARGSSGPVDKSQNQSATRTGSPAGPVRQTDSTSPPDGLNQSARRTLTVINRQEPPIPPVSPVGDAPGDVGKLFDDLVALWPVSRRIKVKAARAAFDAAVLRAGSASQLLDAAKLQAGQEWWTRAGGRYVPRLDNWLRDDRWADGDAGAAEQGVALWQDSRQGVEAMGERLGLGRWDKAAFDAGRGEAWPVYRGRVLAAAAQSERRAA